MNYEVITQDGLSWKLEDVDPEELKQLVANTKRRFVVFGSGIMEQMGNIAIIHPSVPEGETENLYEVTLTNGMKARVQTTEEVSVASHQLNTDLTKFVEFAGAFINPNSPTRIARTDLLPKPEVNGQ